VAISDRYKLSSLAYQALDMPSDWIGEINRMAPEPDILFFLDVTPETAWERVSNNRIQREIFELPEILRRVHANYAEALKRMNPETVVIIHGDHPVESIAEAVWAEVSARLLDHQGAE